MNICAYVHSTKSSPIIDITRTKISQFAPNEFVCIWGIQKAHVRELQMNIMNRSAQKSLKNNSFGYITPIQTYEIG